MRNTLIGFMLLTGCAGFSPETRLQLEQSTPTQTLQEIQPTPLVLNQAMEHKVNNLSPSFNFPTGKSFIGIFKLPPHNPGTVLEVKSYCHCIGLTKGVFIPIAQTLNNQYELGQQIPFNTHTQTWNQPVHYVGGILLKESDKYLLIYTDPKRFGMAADLVRVAVVDQKTERMDYIREGYTRTTYTDRQVAVWWEGDAVGELRLVVKDKHYKDDSD